MPTISNVELITNDIITKMQTITTANGYRNDVANVSKVSVRMWSETKYPQLYVFVLDSKIKAEDMASTVYEEKVTIAIEGYVETSLDSQKAGNLTDAIESLLHDVKKVISGMPTYQINGHYWWIDIHESGIEIDRAPYMDQNKGGFQVRFVVGSYANDDFDARTSA